ncbi:MAG: HDOD domain-containing protein [Candidatus Hydrogenedentota bacterium]
MSRYEIRETLENPYALPIIPGVIIRLLQEEGRIACLSEWVSLDPVLSVLVLGRAAPLSGANYFSQPSIKAAVESLGSAGLRALLVPALPALWRPLSDIPNHCHLGLWRHALASAHIAARLARQTPDISPDTAYAAGLLHDVGKWLYLRAAPDSLSGHWPTVNAGGAAGLEAEHRVFGVDHALGGKWLTESAGAPELLSRVIWLHHMPAGSLAGDSAPAGLFRIVSAANTLARLAVEPDEGSLSKSLAQRVDMEPAAVEELVGWARKEVQRKTEMVHPGGEPLPLDWEELQGHLNSIVEEIEQSIRSASSRERQFVNHERLLAFASEAADITDLSGLAGAIGRAAQAVLPGTPGLCLLPDPCEEAVLVGAWRRGAEPVGVQNIALTRSEEGEDNGGGAMPHFHAFAGLDRPSSPDPMPGAESLRSMRDLVAFPLIDGDCVYGRLVFDLAGSPDPVGREEMEYIEALARFGAQAAARCHVRLNRERETETLAQVGYRQIQHAAPDQSMAPQAGLADMVERLARTARQPVESLARNLEFLREEKGYNGSLLALGDQVERIQDMLTDMQAWASPHATAFTEQSVTEIVEHALDATKEALEQVNYRLDIEVEDVVVRGPGGGRLVRALRGVLEFFGRYPAADEARLRLHARPESPHGMTCLQVTAEGGAAPAEELAAAFQHHQAPPEAPWALCLAAVRRQLETFGGGVEFGRRNDGAFFVAFRLLKAASAPPGKPLPYASAADESPSDASEPKACQANLGPIEPETAHEPPAQDAAPEPGPSAAADNSAQDIDAPASDEDAFQVMQFPRIEPGARMWGAVQQREEANAQAGSADAASGVNAGQGKTGRAPKVLIVDDDEALCDILSETFRQRGYAVQIAPASASARPLLKKGDVDVVLLDIPTAARAMDTLPRWLSEARDAATVIVMTTHINEEDRKQIVAAGARACLAKPFHIGRLLSEVEEAVSARQEDR